VKSGYCCWGYPCFLSRDWLDAQLFCGVVIDLLSGCMAARRLCIFASSWYCGYAGGFCGRADDVRVLGFWETRFWKLLRLDAAAYADACGEDAVVIFPISSLLARGGIAQRSHPRLRNLACHLAQVVLLTHSSNADCVDRFLCFCPSRTSNCLLIGTSDLLVPTDFCAQGSSATRRRRGLEMSARILLVVWQLRPWP